MRQNLGQHFLRDMSVIEDMLRAVPHDKSEVVVEVGPGKGVLTQHLLDRGDRVVGVEFDPDLALYLKAAFIMNNRFEVVHADVRHFNLINHLRTTYGSDVEYSIIANLPYYLTSYFLRQVFEYEVMPNRMALLIQKEVAERLCAKEGTSERSVLSVMTQAYAMPRIVRIVEPKSFNPPPKVHSAVIVFDAISQTFFTEIDRKTFFRLVKAGFGEKRKTILNSLSGGLRLEKPNVEEVLNKAGIDSQVRAQDLSLEQWKGLYAVYSRNTNR